MVLGPYSCTISPEPMILEKTLNLLELSFFCINMGIKDLPPVHIRQMQRCTSVHHVEPPGSRFTLQGAPFPYPRGMAGEGGSLKLQPPSVGKGTILQSPCLSQGGGFQTSLQEWSCSVGACSEHRWLLPDAEAPSGDPLLSSSPPFPLQPEDSSKCLSDPAFLCPGPNSCPWKPSSVSISEGHHLTRFSHGSCSILQHCSSGPLFPSHRPPSEPPAPAGL